jgi:putative transcriptional regulator
MTKRFGKRIIEGLEEAILHEQGKITLRETDLELPAELPTISSTEIAKIRIEIFHMSQPIWARFLGVSLPTVRAWEQGQNEPAGPVRRLLQLLMKDPGNAVKIFSKETKKLKVG